MPSCTNRILLLLMLVAVVGTAQDKPIAYGKGKRVAVLACKAIRESSGVAVSRRVAGVFWTHNDSGDKPRAMAFNENGEDLGELTITGVRFRDCEDMCSYSLGQGDKQKHYLMFADVGDNGRRRKFVTLYIVEEPAIDAAKRHQKVSAAPVITINLTYTDGSHDCESVAVDAASREILLVSKRGRKRFVYTMKLPPKSPVPVIQLESIAQLGIGQPTGMDISPDGRRAVLVTYTMAYEFQRRPEQTWAQAFSAKPRVLAVPARKQGEGICYGSDGKTLFLTSEGRSAPLIKVSVKDGTPD